MRFACCGLRHTLPEAAAQAAVQAAPFCLRSCTKPYLQIYICQNTIRIVTLFSFSIHMVFNGMYCNIITDDIIYWRYYLLAIFCWQYFFRESHLNNFALNALWINFPMYLVLRYASFDINLAFACYFNIRLLQGMKILSYSILNNVHCSKIPN